MSVVAIVAQLRHEFRILYKNVSFRHTEYNQSIDKTVPKNRTDPQPALNGQLQAVLFKDYLSGKCLIMPCEKKRLVAVFCWEAVSSRNEQMP